MTQAIKVCIDVYVVLFKQFCQQLFHTAPPFIRLVDKEGSFVTPAAIILSYIFHVFNSSIICKDGCNLPITEFGGVVHNGLRRFYFLQFRFSVILSS